MDPAVERRLDEIERQVRAARGERITETPWDYNIPSSRELNHLREECGLSREDVAERLGYSSQTIYNYENGSKAPGREFIEKALRLYKMEWPRGPETQAIGGQR